MPEQPNRRQLLTQAAAVAGATVLAQPAAAAERPMNEPFGYCLNTSTIRGQKLPLVDVLGITARAGYEAVEPWVNEIDEYVKQGGSLPDLRKRIADLGLTVAGVIGFAEWIVDDEARRAKGLEEAKRIMDLTLAIGGTRLAAPPAGVSDKDKLDLDTIAARYRALLELGERQGVVPQLELWGFAKVLSRLSEVAYVAVAAAHPQSSILADSYHLYKGGSDYESIRIIAGSAMHVFHVNDYPAAPERKDITDAHRVFPGDGVAPLDKLFRALCDVGFRGVLSLEVFNREYWNQDALYVARSGLEKTRAAVQQALG